MKPDRRMAGAALVELLNSFGVRRAYTVPGESFLPILDAVEASSEMALISTRHESGAAFMAEVEAKLTGMPAAVLATRGVGASNLAIGVHTARQDSTPMLVLLGQVETTDIGREAFQEVDLPAFYGEITKWSATVPRADRVEEFVARALRTSVSDRRGPVMLALPTDVLEEPVAGDSGRSTDLRPTPPAPDDEEIRNLARLIESARRPVAVAGAGAMDARGDLIRFSEAFDVGVYAAFRRQDVFPNDHPNYLGHLTLGTSPEVLAALESADLVLVLGSRLDEVTTQGYGLPNAEVSRVVQIDEDAGVLASAYPETLGLVADVRRSLVALLERAASTQLTERWSQAHSAYLRASAVPEHSRAAEGLDPAEVIGGLRRVLPDDAILANDAGNFSAFLHRYWRYIHPRTQLAPASGAMGYGLPAAIGAKLAAPDRCVVSVSGDGGFLMTGQELETAVRYGVKILAVVLKNGMHGTIAMHQIRSHGRTAGTEIGEVDLAAYAKSLGAAGTTVEEVGELEYALRDALDKDGPALVEVVTDPDLITPTARLSELAGGGAR